MDQYLEHLQAETDCRAQVETDDTEQQNEEKLLRQQLRAGPGGEIFLVSAVF